MMVCSWGILMGPMTGVLLSHVILGLEKSLDAEARALLGSLSPSRVHK